MGCQAVRLAQKVELGYNAAASGLNVGEGIDDIMQGDTTGGALKVLTGTVGIVATVDAANKISIANEANSIECFPAGTLVLSASGAVAIETICVGDYVYAYDGGETETAINTVFDVTASVDAINNDNFVHVSQSIGLHKVLSVHKNPFKELTDLTIIDKAGSLQTITATPGHPFYVPSVREYVSVYLLKAGDKLETVDGGYATVISVSTRQGDFTVYNFVVEDVHNYYVSTTKTDVFVRVHNGNGKGCGPDYSSIENPRGGPKEGADFTPRQKAEAIDINREYNDGVVRSDMSGQELVQPQQSAKGVTPASNEWQVDHIVPKDAGGTNASSNIQVLSRQENRIKSNN